MEHFYQLAKERTFQAYNYGPDKNLELYNDARPLNYMEKFGLIDIPIHFITSLSI